MTIDEPVQTIERLLPQGHLTKIQKLVLKQSWEGRSYLEIAREFGYDSGYVKDTGAKLWQQLSLTLGEKVTKHNVKGVLNRAAWREKSSFQHSPLTTQAVQAAQPTIDWGDAIDVSIFYGRTAELTTLNEWLMRDRCRLVTLLGMGGMGKTALAVKLAADWQTDETDRMNNPSVSSATKAAANSFQYIIWRSLRDAPLLGELLTTLIQFLSPQQESNLPESVGGKLSRLVALIRQSRCLLILDNFDAVLQSGKRAGTYRTGYDDYGEFLRRVGEIAHQSCVVLTSREKPQEVGVLEGDRLPIRTLSLPGLDAIAGQDLLTMKGLTGDPLDVAQLITHYRGNPLALKIAATSIRDLFDGDIARFLAQGTFSFNGMSHLLEQQCDRLSNIETAVMYWLAINREPISSTILQADMVPALPQPQLMEVLESLRWRNLIDTAALTQMEGDAIGFTQQPVVMEYVTDRLIDRISQELVTESPDLFNSHTLMKTQAKEYIRESQVRVLVAPIVARSLTALGSPKQLEQSLQRLLAKLRETAAARSGYGGGNLLNLLRQLETDLRGYDFSHLTIRQAYLQDTNLHHANFAHATFEHCAFASTFGGVTSVAFSANGQQLATSDTNGAIQIWETGSGQQLAICKGHNSWVWSVAFSPDRPLLASCGQDHTVRIWQSQTGKCLQILQGHTSIVTAVAFSHIDGMPSGMASLLASSSEDQTIKLWDVETGACVQTLTGHHACVWSVAFHPNGKTLFSGGEDNAIRTWDLATGRCLKTFTGHQFWVKAIAVSPDGKTLVSSSFDQTIKRWDIATGECLGTLTGHRAAVVSIALSADGETLVSGSYDQTVKLWNVATGRCLKTLQKHTNRVWSVAFHPQGHLLASGGDDYTARLWELRTGQCTKTLQGHSNAIYTIAHNPTDRLLASGHEDQTIKLWNCDPATIRAMASRSSPLTRTSEQPYRTLRGHTNRIFSIVFSPDEQLLASASGDRTIKVWNPHTGKCVQTLTGHQSWVWAIAFSPNGKRIASASYDQTVKLWDSETGDCLRTFEGHTSSVLAIAFSPDGQQLLSGGYEQTIKLWNVATGQCLHTLRAHTNRVWSVAFRPDFKPDRAQFATCGDDQTIKLWDAITGICLQTFAGHTSQVLTILFSADGSQLISGSADQTIYVWDVATGKPLHTLEGHQNWVWSLALSPDDSMLFSGSQDETIKCWDLPTGERLRTLRSHRPYEDMNITGAIGLTDAQKSVLLALGAVSGQPSANNLALTADHSLLDHF